MPPGPSSEARSIFSSKSAMKWLTVLSLLGVTVGVIAGIVVARFDIGAGGTVATANAMVRAWTNAFRMLVAPLVMAQLYLAVSGERDEKASGSRTGLAIPVVFAGLLGFCVIVAFVLTPLLLQLPWVSDVTLVPPAGTAATQAAAAAKASTSAWVDGYIPPNIFAAATTDNILPLMLFALVFAVAVRRAESTARRALYNVVSGVSQASFTIVGWLLMLTPIVMLALGFRSAVESGIAVGETILGFAVLEIIVVLAALFLLYPLTALLGGVPITRLARALWPAQLTAIATRSSLATLPALMSAATTTLGLRKEAAAAVIPAGGAALKLSRAISGPVKILFLAHVLGIDITPERLFVFAVTVMLLSASTVGVATVTSGNRSLPAYVAAGIPAEYVALLAVAVSLTDIFLTVINASGYLSAAAIVDRISGGRRVAIPTPVASGGVPIAAQESMAGVA
jgi:proton glutamate symport protein